MNIFQQYGIKEVADVTLYSIELDENDDEVYVPVIYFDTLKISTLEKTAQQTSARGGLGNPELIIWDYGKEITVTLEDALYSPASQAMMWGGKLSTKKLSLYLSRFIDFAEPNEKSSGAVFNIDTFQNFKIIPALLSADNRFDNEGNYVNLYPAYEAQAYIWLVSGSIITNNGKKRCYVKDVILIYDTKKQKWWFAAPPNKGGNYINAQYGKAAYDNFISHQEEYEGNKVPTLYLSETLFIDGLQKNNKKKYSEITEEGEINYRYRVTMHNTANDGIVPPQEVIYQIDHAIDDTFYLDRMEKCRATQRFCIDTDTNTLHGNYRYLERYSQVPLTVFVDPKTMQPYEPNTDEYYRTNGSRITGNLRIIKQNEIYYKWTRTKAKENMSLGKQIVVDAQHFPGAYRLVGETYSRSRKTGQDQRFQFEIPLCKMGSDNNITLQADGDPTTFTMTLKVLSREDGVMMKLTQYDVENQKYGKIVSGSTKIVPTDTLNREVDLDELEKNETNLNISVSGEGTKESIIGLAISQPADGAVFVEDSILNKADGHPYSLNDIIVNKVTQTKKPLTMTYNDGKEEKTVTVGEAITDIKEENVKIADYEAQLTLDEE